MEPINITRHKGQFFKILGRTPFSQIGVMTIKPDGNSGAENIHPGDQIIYIIEGQARLEINGKSTNTEAGDACIIPAKTRHHIYNEGSADLFFVTIYAPPAY